MITAIFLGGPKSLTTLTVERASDSYSFDVFDGTRPMSVTFGPSKFSTATYYLHFLEASAAIYAYQGGDKSESQAVEVLIAWLKQYAGAVERAPYFADVIGIEQKRKRDLATIADACKRVLGE